MKLFVVPEYTCKHPIFPHHNTVDLMYDAIDKHECKQKDWYTNLFVYTHVYL